MTTTTELALQQHPLSAAFPSMPEQELAALALDIEEHGQREPGILFEGMVLDGWHRYLACDQAGVEFKAVEFDGGDPVAFVLSRNLHRRHLTASQRAAAVVAAHAWRPHGDQKSRSAPGADRTTDELAREAEVSPRTIAHAKVAHQAGLGDAVREGQVSAKDAAELAKGKSLEKAKKPRAVVTGRDVEELYAVKKELADYKDRYETLGETARELQDKLEMYEATEPDAQQKKIAELQKLVQRKDAEIARQRGQISDLNNKCNALIRQVKSLQKAKK